MKKEISFGKLLCVSKFKDADIYIKPSVNVHYRNSKSQVDTFVKTEMFVVHGGFKYYVSEVWDYLNNHSTIRKVAIRESSRILDISGCFKVDELISKGTVITKGKPLKLEISEKLFTSFEEML